MLPDSLKQAIEAETKRYSHEQLTAACEELSKRYRERTKGSQPFMTSDLHRTAYLAARLPATYAVARRVLSEVRSRMVEIPFYSLLDLGSGPGTALWAAKDLFNELEQALLLEQDPALIQIAQRLMQSNPLLPSMKWQQVDLQTLKLDQTFDLAIASYALGELPPETQNSLLQEAWKHVGQALVLIEPGTMAGFETIRNARTTLISLGGYILAPCPHQGPCPMAENDWCHFAERVERTSLHRKMKEGTLGYEDEKYSYVIITKAPYPHCRSRILRHPQKHSGHLDLTLCTPDGLQKTTLSKRDGALYKAARKASWGDELN